jgi:hypothetical protein
MSDEDQTAPGADGTTDSGNEGSENSGWVEDNIRSWRALSDRLGLTDAIEERFAAGRTASEVEADLRERLASFEPTERGELLVSVRASLGIPSRMTVEGQQEFEVWKRAREERLREEQTIQAAPADGGTANEIGFVEEPQPFLERDAANSDDASDIRARQTSAANEADARLAPETPEQPLDDATRERLKKIRDTDGEKARALLNRDSTATDDTVKPASGMGKSLDPKAAGNTIRPKPITEKTGYEVPKSVRDRYVAFEGKYLDRKTETVHFEDKGRSLATASEDRDVIQHMVAIAQAKNWGELQLKGSDEFRRQAWIAAELADVPTRGYKPDAQDRARLAAAREAMRIAAGERSQTNDPERTNAVESSADGKQPDLQPARGANATAEKTGPGAAAVSPASVGSAAPARSAPVTDGQPAADRAEPTPGVSQTQTPPGVTAGVLVAHARAPFNHDDRQNDSYYATVRTSSGEQTVWGLDLERAIAESGVQPGQRIELEKGGSRLVTAQQRQFDENGKELAPKTVTSRRNEWLVYSPDVPGLPTREQRQELASARRELDEQRRIREAREAFLSGNWKYTQEQRVTLEMARERIKEQAAREVLEEEIKGLPEEQKEHLRGEFESAVAEAHATNRPLDVPMPQVSEATIEAVREQISRELAAQGIGQSAQRPEADAGRAPEQPTQEASHDTPSLELEP